MKTNILPFNWRDKLGNTEYCSIGDDFILLENPDITDVSTYPFKLDVLVTAICLRGTMQGSINMQSYTFQGPNLIVVFPGQIVKYESISDDFSGIFIIVSQKFISDLKINVKEALSLNFSLHQKPWIPLNEQGLNVLMLHFEIMKKVMRVNMENPYCIEMVRHITMSAFYGMGFHFHLFTVKGKKSKREMLVEKFLDLVQTHYREQRELGFYADKLCLTPKHLSKVVRETSSTTASGWIENHVILEAKALLKSTDMTIQQISEEMNFPSQSFFGKYFKRCTGMSPSEYKK
ncbi:MAG: helix-turn-helix domain-containing protein [Prevotellaceae bacterium]|jgi:AraC-like DNA-binding protein|nr:helix-turn-helix domain-containing protein [Prevotellaceae bacterium]